MTDRNGAEVIDIIERFDFNLGSAIVCIARAGRKAGSGIIADLEKAQWYLEREIKRIKQDHNETASSSQSSAIRPASQVYQLGKSQAKVNRRALYGKTGWATNTDSTAAHGNIRPLAKSIGNQYVSMKFSPTSVHTHQW